MDEVHLTSQEAWDLVMSILDGIAALDEGDLPRATWTREMRDWCDLLLVRREEGGPTT